MSSRFDHFVILAGMRTGSNLLEATLNGVEGLCCHGEAFNPSFPGHPKSRSLLGMTQAERDADPLGLVARIRQAPGLNGFRYFHDHDPRVLGPLLAAPGCAKIVLTRNPAESYASLRIARQTDQWKLTDARHRRSAAARFDPEGFRAYLDEQDTFQRAILRGLQAAGQTAFFLDYEDLREVEVINGLLAFLGVARRLEALDAGLVPQNPEPLSEKVANFAQMEAALAGEDRFNTGRIPVFEPRRGPGVPRFVAARGAPVLYLPVAGIDPARIVAWLGSLGEGTGRGVTGDFSQKTLRQWMRGHPGHVAFTVLAHPLKRAFDAFRALADDPAAAAMREVLSRSYSVGVPEPGTACSAGQFLTFLTFLKANLAGQTGVRTPGEWASQSACLSGLAEVVPPAVVAREERLEQDLRYLADRAGTAFPGLARAGDPAAVELSSICGPAVEAAGRAAYARDYANFGFGDWAAQAA